MAKFPFGSRFIKRANAMLWAERSNKPYRIRKMKSGHYKVYKY